MARRRGGYQPPQNPAPVSGPGALSQRTDGVPQMERTGLDYGENQAVNEMQSAAPLGRPSPGPQQGGGGGPVRGRPPEGVFAATQRPGEPLTAGIDFGPGAGREGPILEDDPNMLLRAIIAKVGPHPDLLRLMNRA